MKKIVSISETPLERVTIQFKGKVRERPVTPAFALKKSEYDRGKAFHLHQREVIDSDDDKGGMEDHSSSEDSDDDSDSGVPLKRISGKGEIFSGSEETIRDDLVKDEEDGGESVCTMDYTCSASIAETEEDFDAEEEDLSVGVEENEIVRSPITRSQFPGFGDDVLYFPKNNEKVSLLPKSLASGLRWRISIGAPRVIQKALKAAGFEFVTKGTKWVAYWGKFVSSDKFKKFHSWQHINHFPHAFEIGRKDKLWMNYSSMRLNHGSSLINHIPETYLLPRNRANLDRVFSSSPAWILKPPASARGIGIKIITKNSKLPSPSKRKEIICSRYISNPLLINKRKFDLRLYVLVTSFEPLKIYLYEHGLARFASEPYTKMNGGKRNSYRYSHLTNYSVNKKNITVDVSANNKGKFGEGSLYNMTQNKWSLETLRAFFKENGIDFNIIQNQINSIVVKTVMSALSQNVSGCRMYKTKCYELFGFDILIDAKLKAWLMECNISPALKGSCDMDYQLKSNLVVDIFNLVGIKIDDIEKCKNSSKKKRYETLLMIVTEMQRNEEVNTFKGSKDHKKHRFFSQDYSSANKGKSSILDNLTFHDLKVLVEAEEEISRKGNFKRLWPSKEMSDHEQFMPSFNYFDRLLYEWTLTNNDHQLRCQALAERIHDHQNQKHAQRQQSSMLLKQSKSVNDRILDRMSNLTLLNSASSSLSGMNVPKDSMYISQRRRTGLSTFTNQKEKRLHSLSKFK